MAAQIHQRKRVKAAMKTIRQTSVIHPSREKLSTSAAMKRTAKAADAQRSRASSEKIRIPIANASRGSR